MHSRLLYCMNIVLNLIHWVLLKSKRIQFEVEVNSMLIIHIGINPDCITSHVIVIHITWHIAVKLTQKSKQNNSVKPQISVYLFTCTSKFGCFILVLCKRQDNEKPHKINENISITKFNPFLTEFVLYSLRMFLFQFEEFIFFFLRCVSKTALKLVWSLVCFPYSVFEECPITIYNRDRLIDRIEYTFANKFCLLFTISGSFFSLLKISFDVWQSRIENQCT